MPSTAGGAGPRKPGLRPPARSLLWTEIYPHVKVAAAPLWGALVGGEGPGGFTWPPVMARHDRHSSHTRRSSRRAPPSFFFFSLQVTFSSAPGGPQALASRLSIWSAPCRRSVSTSCSAVLGPRGGRVWGGQGSRFGGSQAPGQLGVLGDWPAQGAGGLAGSGSWGPGRRARGAARILDSPSACSATSLRRLRAPQEEAPHPCPDGLLPAGRALGWSPPRQQNNSATSKSVFFGWTVNEETDQRA